MSGFPPGEWSPILVGDQWPIDQDVIAIQQGVTNREIIGTGFTHFADTLASAQSGPLSLQRGHTAGDLREAFRQGEDHALRIAQKNGTKKSAYEIAHNSTVSLRQDLFALAEESNEEINEIQNSNELTAAKVAQIIDVINRCRTQAMLAAAKYGSNVMDAIQRVLEADGAGQSSRQFIESRGIKVGEMYRQPHDQGELESRVRGMMSKPGASMGLTDNAEAPPDGYSTPQARGPGSGVGITNRAESQPLPASQPRVVGGPGTSMSITDVAARSPHPTHMPAKDCTTPFARVPIAPMMPTSRAPGPLAPSFPSASPSAQLATTPPAPTTPPPPPPPPLTPAQLIQSFDKGLQTGAPFSTPTEMPPAPMSPTEHIVEHPPVTPTAPASVPVHAMPDTPPPAHHTPAPEAPPPQIVASAPPPAAPAVANPPAGPLPAYASDLRPSVAVSTTPSAPLSTQPPSATPGSAPVHPSGGPVGTGQPTVVRQTSTPTTPPPPPNPTAQAVAATAVGAATGAASADVTARERLQNLVFAVARQQPRLAWAAGDRADGSTVLATDLAGGWVPPGIDLPAAVTLLPPARRRGGLEAMLGDVVIAAGYTPVHHVPDVREPVPTSRRPRKAPEIDELGWELSQATQWRDGLPRLAHTLAKAASAKTGVLTSETALLHEHLDTVGAHVLDSYPDNVDGHNLGNWQLLAAIDALVAGDQTAANYHLAWFRCEP